MSVFATSGLIAGCAASQSEVAELEGILAAQASATKALEQWCAVRGIADAPRIVARRIPGNRRAEPAGLRERLQVGAEEPLGYRHVELVCGTRVLSVAHNWYVPARLTPAMNAALETTEVPFGKVAAPLAFTRETLDTVHGGEPGCPEGTILSQIALLRLPDGRTLAYLTECYTRITLAADRQGSARG